MKTIITSDGRPLRRALCTLLLGIAALWAMPTSARAQLYVGQFATNSVGEYNATTGAAINASFITGLAGNPGLALSGNDLFVLTNGANGSGPGTVGEYDATTGAAINANFITGLVAPFSIVLSPNNLLVGSSVGTVGEYNATTGAVINANFITGLQPLDGFVSLALSGNTLFVEDYDSTTIGTYDATTGAAINANFITGAPVLA
jgi:hypothetical protein